MIPPPYKIAAIGCSSQAGLSEAGSKKAWCKFCGSDGLRFQSEDNTGTSELLFWYSHWIWFNQFCFQFILQRVLKVETAVVLSGGILSNAPIQWVGFLKTFHEFKYHPASHKGISSLDGYLKYLSFHVALTVHAWKVYLQHTQRRHKFSVV